MFNSCLSASEYTSIMSNDWMINNDMEIMRKEEAESLSYTTLRFA